ADEERSRARAVTGAAAALLRAVLLLGAVHLGAGQDLVVAAAALGELPNHDALDQVGARLEPEDRVVELDLAGRLVVEIEDFGLHAQTPSALWGAFCSATGAASRFFTEPGIGTLSLGRLTASRTITQPPLWPGTAPRTMIRPRSTSTLATSRFCVVTLS